MRTAATQLHRSRHWKIGFTIITAREEIVYKKPHIRMRTHRAQNGRKRVRRLNDWQGRKTDNNGTHEQNDEPYRRIWTITNSIDSQKYITGMLASATNVYTRIKLAVHGRTRTSIKCNVKITDCDKWSGYGLAVRSPETLARTWTPRSRTYISAAITSTSVLTLSASRWIDKSNQ